MWQVTAGKEFIYLNIHLCIYVFKVRQLFSVPKWKQGGFDQYFVVSQRLAFSMELMVTPAEQDTMRWRFSMSGPISSSTNGMMCGLTARKRTSLLLTVSLLLVVKLTPSFCKRHASKSNTKQGLWWTDTYFTITQKTEKAKKLNFDLSFPNPPVAPELWAGLCQESWQWFCGWQLRLKIVEGGKIFPEVNSEYDCNHPTSHTGITAYIQDESVTHKLTCSSEASHHCVGQLASSNETYTHPTCWNPGKAMKRLACHAPLIQMIDEREVRWLTKHQLPLTYIKWPTFLRG